MRIHPKARLAFAAILPLYLVVGCHAFRLPEQNQLTRQQTAEDVSVSMLRAQVFQYAKDLGAATYEASVEIARQTDDPEIRMRALSWRMNAVPVIRDAALNHREPVTAVVDLWALTFQLEDFFATGRGRDAFGDLTPIVTRELAGAEVSLDHMVRAAARADLDVDAAREKIRTWATEHPIENLLFLRDVPLELAAVAADEGPRTAQDALAHMAQDLSLLSERMSAYMRTVPLQARWEAEWLYLSILGDPHIRELLTDVGEAADSLGAINATAEAELASLDARIAEALALLVAERQTVLGDVDRQRTDTLRDVTAERIAVIAAIEAARLDTIRVLREERIATLRDVQVLLDRSMVDAHERAVGVSDHVFRNVVWLAIGAGLLIAVLTVYAVRSLRPRSA